MAPKRKTRGVTKRLSAIYEASPSKGVGSAKTSLQQKRKLSDMLGSQWSKEELERFYKAFRKHGSNWKKVSAAVRNRSADMVEALYTMNRAYLSLPEGTASVAGLIAMMTDRYCNLADTPDSSDIPPPPRKKGRGPTRLKSLTINHSGDDNERLSIDFDQNGMPIGPNANEFISYVGVQARRCASILHETWNQVEEESKNRIWDKIMLTFDGPNTKEMKKRWIKYAGERWRAFKTWLAKEYIYNETDKTPFAKYEFIDPRDWEKFVAIRWDPAFQEKRKKAQEIQAKNVYPHRMSRGGYRKLEKILIEEQKKQFQEQSSGLAVFEPQPIKRHVKWKRARLRPSGEFTSEPSRAVAETIDSLEQESLQGTFVPSGRRDILSIALGKLDHPGRVIGVGWGVGIRQYHGSSPRHTRREDLEALKAQITSEIRAQLESEIRDQLRSELRDQLRDELMQEIRAVMASEIA